MHDRSFITMLGHDYCTMLACDISNKHVVKSERHREEHPTSLSTMGVCKLQCVRIATMAPAAQPLSARICVMPASMLASHSPSSFTMRSSSA